MKRILITGANGYIGNSLFHFLKGRFKIIGIDKEKSARFSFLMVVPLILGKMAKDVLSGEISVSDTNFLPLLIGFIFAFITGLVACRWMIILVKKSQLKYFAYYCFAVGIIVILLFANNSFPCQ